MTGNASVAELLGQAVERLVAGKTDKASARCDFMVSLRKVGLWNLSSAEDWLNTIIDVNTEIRQGWRQYNDGIREGILDAFPAQELFALSKRTPEPYSWAQRWVNSGGAILGGRMVALKDSDVWCRISDFGLPFPAYAPRPGMWVRDVSRRDAMQLGLIDRDRRVCVPVVPRPDLILLDPEPEPDEEVSPNDEPTAGSFGASLR